jgi:hypothetical protein
MQNADRPGLCVVSVVIVLLAGCGGGADNVGPTAATESTSTRAPATQEPTRRPARTLAVPGTQGPQADPHGSAAPAPALVWDAPAGWTEERPASTMRFAQYSVPGSAGDGECIVFYFGPGQGGDPAANAIRWARQFAQPDGSDPVDAMIVSDLPGSRIPVRVVEVTGIYDGGMTMTDAPATEKPDYMLLGGIAQGPDAPWFFKLTGPAETLRAQRTAFLAMLQSLDVDER